MTAALAVPRGLKGRAEPGSAIIPLKEAFGGFHDDI